MHPGWDVRTLHENDETLRNAMFYSLTAGEVINVNDLKTIAVFDGNYTTLYLHASDVHQTIEEGEIVGVGAPLGKQGKTNTKSGYLTKACAY